jgi:endonuclease YncB( thermonuclease family)
MQHTAATLLCLAVATAVVATEVRGDELTAIAGCTLVDAPWADGDSFPVRTPDGQVHTVRLYGADCLEQHVAGETDARRLRAQRRYFGITAARPDAAESIALAKDLARQAAAETRRLLRKPFTIHTSFADLAAHLVSAGLARAYGVSRSTRDGESADDYREFLADRELQAAKHGAGIWAHTVWDSLPAERRLERDEERELRRALDGAPLPAGFTLDPNTASREDLMRLPHVGEALANRIIERRPYKRLTDLLEVDGIGPATYRDLKPLLRIGGAD